MQPGLRAAGASATLLAALLLFSALNPVGAAPASTFPTLRIAGASPSILPDAPSPPGATPSLVGYNSSYCGWGTSSSSSANNGGLYRQSNLTLAGGTCWLNLTSVAAGNALIFEIVTSEGCSVTPKVSTNVGVPFSVNVSTGPTVDDADINLNSSTVSPNSATSFCSWTWVYFGAPGGTARFSWRADACPTSPANYCESGLTAQAEVDYMAYLSQVSGVDRVDPAGLGASSTTPNGGGGNAVTLGYNTSLSGDFLYATIAFLRCTGGTIYPSAWTSEKNNPPAPSYANTCGNTGGGHPAYESGVPATSNGLAKFFSTDIVAGGGRILPLAAGSGTYGVTFDESGLASGTTWSVTLNGSVGTQSSSSSALFVPLKNASYTYSVSPVAGYVVSVNSSGSFLVAGTYPTVNVAFTEVRYVVAFTETGLPANTLWSVTLGTASGSATAPSAIQFQEPNGSYAYTVGSLAGYGESGCSSPLVVSGGSVNCGLAFSVIDYPYITQNTSNYCGNVGTTPVGPGGECSVLLANVVGGDALVYQVVTSYGCTHVPVVRTAPALPATPYNYTDAQTGTGIPSYCSWTWVYFDVGATADEWFNFTTVTQCTSCTGSTVDDYMVDLTELHNAVALDTSGPSVGTGTAGGTSTTLTYSTTLPGDLLYATFGQLRCVTHATIPSGWSNVPSISALWGSNACGNVGGLQASTLTDAPLTPSGSATFTAQSATLGAGRILAIEGPSNARYTATFTESGLPSGTTWGITLNGNLTQGTGASLSFVIGNGSYGYTVSNVPGWRAASYAGSVLIAGGGVTVTQTFNILLYRVTLIATGLPAWTGSWFANETASNGSALGPVSASYNSPLAFFAANGTTISPNAWASTYAPSLGRRTVSGGPLSESVSFAAWAFQVTLDPSGLPSTPGVWFANESAANGTTLSRLEGRWNAALSFFAFNGTTVRLNSWENLYLPAPSKFTVSGAGIDEPVVFAPAGYAISFLEAGLPSGTAWAVTLNGNLSRGSGSAISDYSGNGSFAYNISNVPGWRASRYAGVVAVNGAAVDVSLTFTIVLYAVTLSSSGLAPWVGAWFLNETASNGSALTSLKASPGTPLALFAANGTSIALNAWRSYYAPDPATLVVEGASIATAIDWIASAYPVVLTASGLPAAPGVWFANETAANGSALTAEQGPSNGAIALYAFNGTTLRPNAWRTEYSPTPASVVIEGAGVAQVVTFVPFGYTVAFHESGLPDGAVWYVNVSGEGGLVSPPISGATGTSLSLLLVNASYTYLVATNEKNWSTTARGSLSVAGAPQSISLAFGPFVYPLTLDESGLPDGATWYINLSGQPSLSAKVSGPQGTSLITLLSNATYPAVAATDWKNWTPEGASLDVHLAGGPVLLSVIFAPVAYPVRATESGLPNGATWYLNLTGESPLSGTISGAQGSTLSIAVPNGSYAYSIATNFARNWTLNDPNGTIAVAGAPVDLGALFSLFAGYSVTFAESALAAGATWYVNVSGAAPLSGVVHGSSDSLTAGLDNGTYAFGVATNDKTWRTTANGLLTVAGAALTIAITFTPVVYTATVDEVGLPNSVRWFVNLSGEGSLSGQVAGSNGIAATISLTNGSYVYAATTGAKNWSAAGGTAVVHGAPLTVVVTFAAFTYPLTISTSGLGGTVTWFVNFTGGPEGGGYGLPFTGARQGASYTLSGASGLMNGSYTYAVVVESSAYSYARGGTLTVLAGYPGTLLLSFVGQAYAVEFVEVGLPDGAAWYVNVSGELSVAGLVESASGHTIPLALGNGSFSYLVATGWKNWSTTATGAFTIAGAGEVLTSVFAEYTLAVSLQESGLPNGVTWYANVTGEPGLLATVQGSLGATLTTALANGTYDYAAQANLKLWRAPGGAFTVAGRATTVAVAFGPFTFSATFAESGLPAGSVWYLNLTSGPGGFALPGGASSSAGSTIVLSLANGTYTFGVATNEKSYAALPATGRSATLTIGSPATSIAFVAVTYLLSATETGLPNGATWYLNLSGVGGLAGRVSGPTGTSLALELSNASYGYTVATDWKNWTLSAAAGTVTIAGSAKSLSITFMPIAGYLVTITESGLPDGATWYVNLSGQAPLSATVGGGDGTAVALGLVNGAYVYVVATNFKNYSTAANGALSVNSQPASVAVAFRAWTYAVSLQPTGLPSGAPWFANLTAPNGSRLSTVSAAYDLPIAFRIFNGSYVVVVNSWEQLYAPDPGRLAVSGAAALPVAFTAWRPKVSFVERGLPDGAVWYVNLTGASAGSAAAGVAIPFELGNGTYPYRVATNERNWSATLGTGTATVVGTAFTVNVTFVERAYAVTFAEAGLPSGASFYVNLSGEPPLSATVEGVLASSVTIDLSNATYDYSVATNEKNWSTAATGALLVAGAATTIVLRFSAVAYLVTFTESGLPDGAAWYVNLSGLSLEGVVAGPGGASVASELSNGTYGDAVATAFKNFSTAAFGTFSVLGAPTTVDLDFVPVLYGVTFQEGGLPGGAEWYVNLSAPARSAPGTADAGAPIGFSLMNGSYAYALATNEKGWSTTAQGTLEVDGASVAVAVTFSRYPPSTVTFRETGLPDGATWYVNVTGAPGLSGLVAGPTGQELALDLSNGSYGFSLATNEKNWSTTATGTVRVSGNATVVPIAFAAVTYELSFVEGGLPDGAVWFVNLTLGTALVSPPISGASGTVLTVELMNGSYAYAVATGLTNWTTSPTGTLSILGAALSVPVAFVPSEYAVLFVERGLPEGAIWYVNLSGGASVEASVNATGGTTLELSLADGSYAASLATNEKNWTTTAEMAFTVAGRPVRETVAFVPALYALTFAEEGLTGAVRWTVTLTGPAGGAAVLDLSNSSIAPGTIGFLVANESFDYAIAPLAGYSTPWNGTVVVDGGPRTVLVTFAVFTYPVTFVASGLPSGLAFGVTILPGDASARLPSARAAPLEAVFELANGTFGYAIAPVPGYRTQWSGAVTVSGAPLWVSVAFVPTAYRVTFTETGLADGAVWSVDLNGVVNGSSAPDPVGFAAANGSWTFSIVAPAGYAGAPSTGALAVDNASLSVAITFSAVAPSTYAIEFTEGGLGPGLTWWVNLSGAAPEEAAPGATIVLYLTNGTYAYRVGVDGLSFAPVPSGGTVHVTGQPLTVDVPFATAYVVSVLATSLPNGTLWFVNVSGTAEPRDRPIPAAATAVSYSFSARIPVLELVLPNGSYRYTVWSSDPTLAPESSRGNLTVAGAAETASIAFVAAYEVTFTESGLPAGTEWTVELDGALRSSTSGSLSFPQLVNGSYAWTVSPIAGFSVSPSNGSARLAGSGANIALTFEPATEPASALPWIDVAVAIGAALVLVAVGAAWYAAKRSRRHEESEPGDDYP